MKPIINLHIPKNAGSTLDIIFKNIYGQGFYRMKNKMPGFINEENEVKKVLDTKKYTFLSGHSLSLYDNLDVSYITFLRNPEKRIVSLYKYEKKHGSELAKKLEFNEWVVERNKEDTALQNYQYRQIMNLYNKPMDIDFKESDVDEIINKFFFIGIIEEFDKSLLYFSKLTKKNKKEFLYLKANQSNSEKINISDETRQLIKELNSIDYLLYSKAVDKLKNIEILEVEIKNYKGSFEDFKYKYIDLIKTNLKKIPFLLKIKRALVGR
jgi:hypothetical protein